MLQVAIVGAGDLGGATAHAIAVRDVASTIRLVDRGHTIAAGKALDIMQAAPIQQFATRVVGSDDLFAVAGSHVIMLADRGGERCQEWQGAEALELLAGLVRISPGSVFLCVGASHRELVERGVGDRIVDSKRLFGTAPEALAAAMRASVALEADTSIADVSLTVLGVPPDRAIVPWDQATINGFALTRRLQVTALRRLAARVAPLWPPGTHSLAAAAALAVDCIAGQSRRMVSCFVAPAESGARRTVAIPARLGWSGVVSADVPDLNAHDRVALENAWLL